MGASVTRDDFEWVYTEEPHATRRKQILAKHPEIKHLMGHDYRLAIAVTLMVLTQVCTAYAVRSWSWPALLICAYCFGGVINHSLTLAIHEIAHNLAFGHTRPMANRLLGLFANLPIGVPSAVTFKKYHLEHHKYQGDSAIDMDIPSALEGRLFSCTALKFVWLLLQPFFYALRPLLLRPKPPSIWEGVNWVAQVSFDAAIVYFFGVKSLLYLIFGSLLAMGVHPVAGHFVSEHYMFTQGAETYSYYGPLNWITFNVGYHNEHHDFPNIPGFRLPQVRQLAPEFYEHLPCHYSWSKVLWDFVMNPAIGPYSRVKRPSKKEE